MNCGDYFLIYIHGFNSSPQSHKALQAVEYFESMGIGHRIVVPELSHEPDAAIRQLQALIETPRDTPVVLIGSSLGGYYATWLAEQYNLKAALINPSVRPYERWEQHLGLNHNFYSGKSYEITREHIEQLRKLDRDPIVHPENFLLLVQTGDEVLDYRLAVEKYKASPSIIQEGGNHGFVNFEEVLPAICNFFTH